MISRGLPLFFSFAIAAVAGTAFTACSSSSNKGSSNPDGGSSSSSGSSGGSGSSSGGSGSSSGGADGGSQDGSVSDSGSSSGGSGSSSGGSSGGSCATTGNTLCTQMSTCDSILFQVTYGDMTTCQAAVTYGCSQPQLPHTTGLNNQAMCLSDYTASCASYFETVAHPPQECLAAPGTVADQATGCGYASQCVAGDYCDNSNVSFAGGAACQQGTCSVDTATGSSCDPTIAGICSTQKADQCVATFADNDAGDTDGYTICQQITYGGAGADCAAGTNKECQSGFACAGNNKCGALLTANQSCDPTNDLCDTRFFLHCDATSTACIPSITPVPAGAQCGNTANGAVNTCNGNLFCDTTQATPTCKAQVTTAGQGCVAASVDECSPFAGLHCAGPNEAMPSTCEAPLAPVCM